MTQGKKIIFGGRRQGKTLDMQEMTKAAIERGENLYLTDATPIGVNMPFERLPQCGCDPGTGVAPPPCTCGFRKR